MYNLIVSEQFHYFVSKSNQCVFTSHKRYANCTQTYTCISPHTMISMTAWVQKCKQVCVQITFLFPQFKILPKCCFMTSCTMSIACTFILFIHAVQKWSAAIGYFHLQSHVSLWRLCCPLYLTSYTQINFKENWLTIQYKAASLMWRETCHLKEIGKNTFENMHKFEYFKRVSLQ